MKTRNGFVSNSSSSSFIVIRGDFFSNKAVLITKKEEAILEKFGFKKVWCYYSDQVATDERFDKSPSKAAQQDYNYGYYISCNQNEVIYFLLKHNIPFEASCHYNHYQVIYNKNSKYFLEVQNYGEQCAMANTHSVDKNYKDVFDRTDFSEPIKKVNVKQWLKDQDHWQKEFDKEFSEAKKSV
jgi:hypothetical protein